MVIVNVEAGLVKGSRWFLAGNLGLLVGVKIRAKRSIEVTINLSKLADWVFPTELDPKEPANMTVWKESMSITKSIKEGGRVISDPSEIQGHQIFTVGKGFSIQMTVVSTQGGCIWVWLSCAPLNRDLLKQECEDRGLTLSTCLIPTTGIKLPSAGPQSKNECTGQYLPLEKGEAPCQPELQLKG